MATYVLVGLNALVFLLMVWVDAFSHPSLADLLTRTFTGLGSNPESLLRFGASYGPYTRRGEYFRLVMPMFLHIGLLHLVINNYSLYVLGQFLERIYGYARFAFLYVATGVGSAFVSMRMSAHPSAGASGAIFGIAGVMLVAGYLHRESIPRHWGRAFGRGILPVIVLNLALGLALHSFVDNWAHVGGLVCGMLLGLVIPPPPSEDLSATRTERFSLPLLAVPIAVVAVAMVGAARNYRTSSEVSHLDVEGEQFHAAHRDDWAEQRFRAAAALGPRDEHPHEELGLLYLGENKFPQAITEYTEALRLNYLSSEAPVGLAQAYRALGNDAQAQVYLRQFTKDFPDTAEAQYELASVLVLHHLLPEAATHYQQSLQLNPDSAEVQKDLAWLLATADDPKVRNPQSALEHARRAIELSHWTEPNIIDTLAEALYANQQYAEAVKTQARALRIDPHNAELAEHMARYRKAASLSN